MPSYHGGRDAFYTLRDMARIFRDSPGAVEETFGAAVDAIGKAVQARAREYLGVPQTTGHGGFPPWPPLAPSTLARKGADTPLMETGALADSIDYEIVSQNTVEIGTDILSARGEPYGKYLEEGTSRMPPRPFLHPAAVEVVAEMVDEIGEAIVSDIGREGGAFSVLRRED